MATRLFIGGPVDGRKDTDVPPQAEDHLTLAQILPIVEAVMREAVAEPPQRYAYHRMYFADIDEAWHIYVSDMMTNREAIEQLVQHYREE